MKLKKGDLVKIRHWSNQQGIIDNIYYNKYLKREMIRVRMHGDIIEFRLEELELILRKNHPNTDLFK